MTGTPKTVADLFREVGPLLAKSEDWMAELALTLGIKRETVRNICRGQMTHSADAVAERLAPIVDQRLKDLRKAQAAIKTWRRAKQQ